ncbi:MAG: polysaccharide deacetylase family protein [Bacteriovorax sp.]|nr:polysaccharide deacetylase family protein [Bacteriovorax sp.]
MRFLAVLLLILSVSAQAKIKLAITIDDLPNHGELPKGVSRVDVAKKMLAVLKKEKIPEVYGFINAAKVKDEPLNKEVLNLWVKEGYPLANHTYTHMDLNTNNVMDFQKEIKADEEMLIELNGGMNYKFFRYPYLREGAEMKKRNSIRKYLAENKYQIAQVSVDFEDWSWNDPYARCVNKKDQKAIKWLGKTYQNNAVAKLKEAALMSQKLLKRDIPHILLLHIGAFDAEMLSDLIKNYRAQGVEFISLTEASKDQVYIDDPGIAGKWGAEILQQIRKARNLKLEDIGIERYTGYPQKELQKICL